MTDAGASQGRLFDAYLVASARVGDRRALTLLARRWNVKFLAHARRLLGSSEAAHDVVQDAWGEIVRGMPRLADVDAFPAWAYRIVSRRCARAIWQVQHDRRLKHLAGCEPGEASIGPDGRGADATRLHRAMAALPPEQRAAIALFHLEEMSVAEVAVVLDVPAGTVKTRLMAARAKLRAAFEGDL